jgi:hypothetical protein
MGPLDKDLFGYFSNNFLFSNDWHFLNNFLIFVGHNYLIPVLDNIHYFYLRHFNLNWYFLTNVDDLLLFDDVIYYLLYLTVLWLFDYLWNSNLDLSDLLDAFIDIVWDLNYFLYFNILFSFCLYYFLNLSYLNILDYLLDLNLFDYLLSFV